jgi:hypothetical protein
MSLQDATRPQPSTAVISDAVFKTFIEGVVLIALSIAHLTIGFSFGALIVAAIALLIGSLVADSYLFGSIGRAFAARRAIHFKSSPLLLAAVLIFYFLPVESDSDKLIRFALAAGLGGVATALLNLDKWGRTDA